MKQKPSYTVFLALLFIQTFSLFSPTASAQKIVYSQPEKQDFDRFRFDIIAQRNDRLLVYKATYFANPFRKTHDPAQSYSNPDPAAADPLTQDVHNPIETSSLLVYDTNMQVIAEKSLPFPKEITGVHFLVYEDFFYAFYQYLEGRTIHCMASRFDLEGKPIGEPIDMDHTQSIDIHYQSQIYSVINSEDKRHILLFKLGTDHTLTSVLFDSNLHALRRSVDALTMEGSAYLTEFRLDNEGNFLFVGSSGAAKYHNPNQATLFVRQRQTNKLSYTYLAPETITVDDIRVLIDNRNHRYILGSFYSRRPEGDIEGLFTFIHDAANQAPDKTTLTPLPNHTFNNYYIQEMHLRKDGSYTLEAQELILNPDRHYITRWNYQSELKEQVASVYTFFDAYENNHYYPWKNWHNQPGAGFSSRHSLIACLDSNGVSQWTHTFETPQLDRFSPTVGYKSVISDGLLYFLYNAHIRQQSYLTAQSIDPQGEMNTDSRLKEDKALPGESNEYTYFPRLAKIVDAGEVIVPCRKGPFICLAKISF
ncbi:MAG: hypothetical protein JST68_12170 [Bacteroidetes bacterium]|nr:hypothetical protein [Bacteroidota bacterium]